MLSFNLKLFLLLISFCYFFIVFRALKKQKIPVSTSILWVTFGVILVVCIFFQPLLQEVCDFLGIEKVSNMLLFCGFIALLILSFNLYILNNNLKQKTIQLGQELSILKNEIKRK